MVAGLFVHFPVETGVRVGIIYADCLSRLGHGTGNTATQRNSYQAHLVQVVGDLQFQEVAVDQKQGRTVSAE